MIEGADTDVGDRRPGVDDGQVGVCRDSNRCSGNGIMGDAPVELRPAFDHRNDLAEQIDDDQAPGCRSDPFGMYRVDRSNHVEVSASHFYHRADTDRVLGESVDLEGCGHLRARHRQDTSDSVFHTRSPMRCVAISRSRLCQSISISAVEDFYFVIELGDLALPRKTATIDCNRFYHGEDLASGGEAQRLARASGYSRQQAYAAEAELNFERPLLDRYQPVDFGRQHVECTDAGGASDREDHVARGCARAQGSADRRMQTGHRE